MYEIAREQSYEDDLVNLRMSIERMHDFELMIEWAIKRSFDFFDLVRPNYYVLKTQDMINFPAIRILIFYNPNEPKVFLVNVGIV